MASGSLAPTGSAPILDNIYFPFQGNEEIAVGDNVDNLIIG